MQKKQRKQKKTQKTTSVIVNTYNYVGPASASFTIEKNNKWHYFIIYFKKNAPTNNKVVLIKNLNLKKEITKAEKQNSQQSIKIYVTNSQWSYATINDVLNTENLLFASFEYPFLTYEQFFSKETKNLENLITQTTKEFNLNYNQASSAHSFEEALQTASSLTLTLEHKKALVLKILELATEKLKVEQVQEVKTQLEKLERYSKILESFTYKAAIKIKNQTSASYAYEELKKIKKDTPLRELLTQLKSSKGDITKNVLTAAIIRKILDENKAIKQEHVETFEKLVSINPNFEEYQKIRWALPSNTTGKTIDISKATPVKSAALQLSNFITANRIGNISRNDQALYLREQDNSGRGIAYYIKGGKKLKREIAKKGGKLQKYENTLVVKKNSIYSDLMEIEKLTALAFLNPKAVLETLKKNKVDTTKLQELAPKIEKNYKYARFLADSAVELLYNLDPQVVKKLIKQHNV